MFSSIPDIEKYLQKLIPDSSKLRFPGNEGIIRTKEFLQLLGSPQNKLKIIHVAGTSGKGSTSFMISNLLVTHGFKVGLSLSPHLLDIRERMEINNELISEKKYTAYFNDIKSSIEKMRQSRYGKITYFEAMVGMTYHVFAQENVDYAVIETGLGGQFDGTNCVDRADKVAVLSKIGFDHMKVLGNRLSEIAHQKAMICAKGGNLITIYQHPSAYKEIEKVVRQQTGHLSTVEKSSIRDIKLSQKDTTFTFKSANLTINNITLGLLGAHQVQNASLALATLGYLSTRDMFTLNIDTVVSTLRALRFKGRFDIISMKNGQIILDGAHNVPKMKALLKTLKNLYPEKKYIFVIAFKKGKEYKKMVQLIIPYAEKIIITHIFSASQDLLHFSVSPDDISREIIQLGFLNVAVMKSIKDIVALIKGIHTSLVVVSGSLYLLGDIYKELE
jgi:dihydrofolate synthase/folylpolyglutamate synthase